jgi:hypothetical protein
MIKSKNPLWLGLVIVVAGCSIAATSVELSLEAITMAVGATQQLSATIYPMETSNQSVSWTTSDETVATVNDAGLVVGVGPGKATITVTTTIASRTDACEVTVGASVSGVMRFNGQPHLSDIVPLIQSVKDVDADEWMVEDDLTLTYDGTNGEYQLAGLPDAKLRIWLYFPYTPESWNFGGNYITEAGTIDLPTLTVEQRSSYDIELLVITRLTQPRDNATRGETSASDPYPVHSQPVQIEWDAVPQADRYRVRIDRYRSPSHPDGYGYLSAELDLFVTAPNYSATLTANAENENYALRVDPYNLTTRLGYYMHTYSNGYGWDYRFSVAP